MCESLMKNFWFLNWHCITYLCRCSLTGANISKLAGRSWYMSTNLFKADKQWFNAEILKLIQVASKHRLDRHTAHLPNIDKVRLWSYFGATLEARALIQTAYSGRKTKQKFYQSKGTILNCGKSLNYRSVLDSATASAEIKVTSRRKIGYAHEK